MRKKGLFLELGCWILSGLQRIDTAELRSVLGCPGLWGSGLGLGFTVGLGSRVWGLKLRV